MFFAGVSIINTDKFSKQERAIMKVELIDENHIQLIAEGVDEQTLLTEWSKESKTIQFVNSTILDRKVSEMTIKFIDREELK